jgi:SpoVK/Ycf46/Vps4 family AAA+-type ATPase
MPQIDGTNNSLLTDIITITKKTEDMFEQIDDVVVDLKFLNMETQEKLEVVNDLLKKVNENLKIINPSKEKIIITEQVNNLDDLLKLAKKYGTFAIDENVNINTKILFELIEPVKNLIQIVGMNDIKNTILDLILTSMQNLYDPNTLFHTIITGPPGVGKTMLAKILGEIYLRLGILENEEYVFKIAKRSDLIGKYLGHTAVKTQEFIDSCTGGVLFIDEVYSLGNEEKRDSFSKECIDTINLNLTEKENFICIVAGYPDEIENCFFSVNPGLKRRYPFRYEIKGYTHEQLSEIFISKINNFDWIIDAEDDQLIDFFKQNKKNFIYFGGDIDNLIMNCKTCHSRRIFGKNQSLRKKITIEDIEGGFKKLQSMRNTKEDKDTHINNMYI